MPQKDLGTQSNRVVDGERANNQARNLHSLIFPPNRVLLLELQTDVVNLLLIEIIDLAFPGAWLALVFAYRELLAPHGPHCVRGQVCVATTRSHVTLSEALPISYRRCVSTFKQCWTLRYGRGMSSWWAFCWQVN